MKTENTASNQKMIVHPLGNNQFRLSFPQKISGMQALLITGSHKGISVITNKSGEYVTAIQGSREDLLRWLESLDLDEGVIESYKKSMPE